ncbi:MAG: hypothetical protein ACK500_08685 [Flavobacteriales bacterium]|jgi:hypothetical protein
MSGFRWSNRLILFALLSALFSSCMVFHPVAELNTTLDSTLAAYYSQEQIVTEGFIRRRSFHQDMTTEVMDAAAGPYPSLGALFREMKESADSVIVCRMEVKRHVDAFQSLTAGRSRVRESTPAWSNYLSAREKGRSLTARREVHFAHFQVVAAEYDSIVAANGIRKITNSMLVELAGARVLQFQDSLEEQGRILARCKKHLNDQGWERKSAQYKDRYRIISEMEYQMKVYSGLVSQLENALNRFESGNMEDFYFVGPLMPGRDAVRATEDVVVKCTLEMNTFRQSEQAFMRSFDPPPLLPDGQTPR